MEGRQKALFWFLLLLLVAFSQLNFPWKFELTTFPFSLRKFQAFFAIIFNNRGKTVIRLVFLSVSMIWTVKYCTKTWHIQILIYLFIFFHFVIIFYSLSSRQLPAWPLLLIVLHNGVIKHSREKGVICDVHQNEEFRSCFRAKGYCFFWLTNYKAFHN